MTAQYRLYGARRSSASYRVRIALHLKGLAFAETFLDLQSGEHEAAPYRSINPQGLVPLLVCPDGTRLVQSLAIIGYLDDVHRAPPLLPADAAGRARVWALAQIVACDMHPVNNMRIRNHVRDLLPGDPDAQSRWMARWSKAGFDALEALLAEPARTGPLCHGDTPGVAEACLVPQVYNARLSGFDLEPYPRVCEVNSACAEFEPFRAAHPDNL